MKKMKLETSISTTNMNLFNSDGQITKYNSATEVIREYFPRRLSLYSSRKDAMLEKMEKEHSKLSNQVRFILAVINGELVVSNRPKQELLSELKVKKFTLLLNGNENDDDTNDEEDEPSQAELSRGYDYLLGMKIWSLTEEKVQELSQKLEEKDMEIEKLRATASSDLWLSDLEALEEMLHIIADNEAASAADEEKTRKKAQGGKGGKKAPKKAKKAKKAKKSYDSDEESEESEFEDDSDDDDFVVKKKAAPKKKAASSVTAAKPKAAAPPVAKKAVAAAKVVKAPESDDDESDEEEILSLADRMKLISTSTVSVPVSPAMDDDVFEEEKDVAPKPAKKSAAGSKKSAAGSKKSATGTKRAAKGDKGTQRVQVSAIFSPEPAPQAKKKKAGKQKPSLSKVEDSDEDMEVESKKPSQRQRRPTSKKVAYDESDEEEDQDDEDDFEEENEDEYEDDDEDESDYED